MSYCRFTNTLQDLQDCHESMDDPDSDELSKAEKQSRKRLIKLCRDIADDYEDEIED